MFEIELKARLTDRSAAADRISGFAEYAGFAEKHDTYWHPADTTRNMPVIRVRETGEETVVTFKKKELRDTVEVNNETECIVSGREAFETLLRALGFVPGTGKHKSTSSWRYENALIEISAVEGLGGSSLGDFIEIEILSEANDPETIQVCTAKLHGILELAGVPETAIERRPYTQLLSGNAD